MVWPAFSMDVMFKRIIGYLLKRFLGQYLQDFSQDELNYSLKDGKGSIENVLLDCEALNELCEEYNLPIELQQGSIEVVSLSIPWTSVFTDNTLIDLKGIRIVAQPKERPEDVSMFESVWGSMTSSLKLAEDCLKNSKAEDDEEIIDGQKTTGVQKMAQFIDTFMANMKVRLYDTSIKIEYVPSIGPHGVALEIKIASAEYFDEAGVSGDVSTAEASEKTYEPQAFSFKKFNFEGVSLFTSQFSPRARAATKTIILPDRTETSGFIPGSPEMPPTHSSLPVNKIESDLQDEEPILISKLSGRQILRLKLKQKEEIIGPKVDVEFNLGAFNLFLTPQQVHMLYEIMCGLIKPCSSNESSCKLPLSVPNKPMKQSDFDLLGQQILRQQQKSDMPSKSLKIQQGWSSHSLDESDDEFQLMASGNKFTSNVPTPVVDTESMCSSVSSDTRSDWSSNCLGGNPRPSKHRGSTVQAMLQDQLSELTHFQGSCSSICIIILHEDIVQESLNKGSNDVSNSKSLKERAECFFEDLLALQMTGIDFTNFAGVREPLSSICTANHMRLMASSLSISGNELSSSAQYIVNFTLSLYQFEVLECLFNSADKPQTPTYVPVLTSIKKETDNDTSMETTTESFKLNYLQTQHTTQSCLTKPPANKLDIRFGDTICEFDISLTDRIQTLLNFQNTSGLMDVKNDWHNSEVGSVTSSTKTELTISSPNFIVNLRFPIPDLRSVHDINRVPWWQQNLHKEVLILNAKDVTFNTTLDGDVTQGKYEVQCRDLHGFLKLSDEEEPISFLRVSVDPDVDEVSQDKGFDWPRLVIRSTTNLDGALEREHEEEAESNLYSLSDVLLSNMDTDPSPFRSISVAYGSKLQKNSSEKAEKSSMSLDHDEVIKPADKVTMSHFIEEIVNKSQCLLEFFLPTVNIVFPSKDFFELLYNRLSNDLLLWERTASTPKTSHDPNGFRVHIPGLDFNGIVPMTSTFQDFSGLKQLSNDSNSDSDDEEESNFCSVYEYCQKKNIRHKKKNQSNAPTKLSVSFAITKGKLTIYTSVQDNSLNALPDVSGLLQLNVQDGSVFIASSYKGDPNESYFCVTSEKSILYHNGATAQHCNSSIVEPLSSNKPSNLDCIIYATEEGMLLKSPSYDMFRSNDMLKIACHVVHNPKQQLKSFKVAIDLSNATLRHFTHSVPQMWINQLIDFLKVDNFPVNGYIPSAVVTEFHLNLSNCCIDYRPLNLPLRCAITVDNFNMSCNIAATTPTFLFRLISEEMRLFISNKVTAKKGELQKNYVCIIDTGLIDVSFRTSVDEKNNPKLELCASNNMIHIRTCSDSFKALIDLIIYLSANGDLEPDEEEAVQEEKEKPSTVHPETGPTSVDLLMAEAMKDCKMATPNVDVGLQKSSSSIADMDDEFCILEDDPGVGLIPRNGEPQIRILTNSPIKIVENYFSVPPGKSDVLQAPKHFPKPIMSLSLREMSLVWHLYGGSDFNTKAKSQKRSKDENAGVTFADEKTINIDTGFSSVAFCKVTPMTAKFDVNNVHYSLEHVSLTPNVETDARSWLKRGGPDRDQEVLMELQMNKVKFQRDVFAAHEEFASRYVLLIADVEIRDRLKSSQINKFLYQYSSQKIPRQSHANMIEVKATYTRPDPKLTSEECSLKVSCKPLRLNVDQDSLLFLLSFFKEALGIDAKEDDEESDGSKPIEKASNIGVTQKKESPIAPRRSSATSTETFYRYFFFDPEVLIRIDYQGKHVLMEQGALKGLLFGLTKLNSSEIILKPLRYRHGLLGHHKVLSYAINEWHQDIMSTQLPGILGGLGPLNTFVQLFQGVKDFFYLPVAQYQKDGQIVKGLQRGASSFSTSALMATLDLFSGLVSAIQGAAIFGYDMVSPGPSVANRYQRNSESSRQTSQPADIREGIASALNVVKEGFGDATRAIYSVAYTEHEHKGVPGAVGGVLRQIPPTLFKPIILGSEATNYVLGGVRHQLMPDAHQEDIHKWRNKNS